jgi:hypothetical protein
MENQAVLMRALLQITMATEDAMESANDPITPSWKPAVILTSWYFSYCLSSNNL